MSAVPRRTAIIGASAAGLAVATGLRDEGYDGEIVLVGAEAALPYDRPPLSKRLFQEADALADIALTDDAEIEALKIDGRLGKRAERLDLEARTVDLDDGTALSWDACVIATGAAPIRLPGEGLVLRGFGDALAISQALQRARHVVVIGGGVLGCELAALVRSVGASAVVVDLQDGPMLDRLGPLVSSRLETLHIEKGVEFRFRTAILRIDGTTENGFRVTFSDGRQLETDLVLVAIGCRPATDWLSGSGLGLDDGILCDQFCAASDGVFAAGDVASWINPRYGRRMRIEHRMNATEQGMAVAANLLGAGAVFDPIPFFWTDQYDTKVQVHGVIDGSFATEVLVEEAESGGFVIAYSREGMVEGVLGWNMARALRSARSLIGRDLETARSEFLQMGGS